MAIVSLCILSSSGPVLKVQTKYLHLKLADLYESADDHAGAVAIYERTLKSSSTVRKFGVPLWYIIYEMGAGKRQRYYYHGPSIPS